MWELKKSGIKVSEILLNDNDYLVNVIIINEKCLFIFYLYLFWILEYT